MMNFWGRVWITSSFMDDNYFNHFVSPNEILRCSKLLFFLHLSRVSLFPATEKETPTNNSHRCLDQSVCHKTSQQPSINLQEEGNRTLTNLLMNQNFWQTLRNIGHWSITFIYFCTTADEISTATCGAVWLADLSSGIWDGKLVIEIATGDQVAHMSGLTKHFPENPLPLLKCTVACN